tara:strand:- start:873 stop:1307 length:435 start_codon:yes stop_codon:yes gene_type:complete
MALYRLRVQTDLDISLSPGDQLFYISSEDMASSFGISNAAPDSIKYLGIIKRIGPIAQQGVFVDGQLQITENGLNKGDIEFESEAPTDQIEAMTDFDFIFFRKNEEVNKSGLKGYYMQTTFINNDYNNPAELFAIGSEVSGSSK